jgi:hypothetical protein
MYEGDDLNGIIKQHRGNGARATVVHLSAPNEAPSYENGLITPN